MQKQIGDNPGTQDLKRKLLETALDGLEKVAKSDETSGLLGQSTAAAYMRMGQLFQEVGLSEKAFIQFQKCHEIVQTMALKEPDSEVRQANLAASFTMLGEMSLQLRRDMPASLGYYQKALTIRRQLNGRQSSQSLDPVRVKRDFAEACTRVGVTYLRLGEPNRAREFFHEALQLRQALATANADPAAKLDVARSLVALAEVDFRTRTGPQPKSNSAKCSPCDRFKGPSRRIRRLPARAGQYVRKCWPIRSAHCRCGGRRGAFERVPEPPAGARERRPAACIVPAVSRVGPLSHRDVVRNQKTPLQLSAAPNESCLEILPGWRSYPT